jgi:hypothetical protein
MRNMKKLLFSAVLVTFAIAAQAGDTKATKESSGSCCASKATSSTTQTKSTCSMGSQQASTSCCSTKAPVRQALMSPKAAAEVAKRL